MQAKWPRNLPLVAWSPNDILSLDSATAGILVTGASGSGKSSAIFNTLFRAFLRARFGLLMLCAKNDAASEYCQIARNEGRAPDVVIVRSDTPNQGFNFLTYEAQRSGSRAIVENIVGLLVQSAEIASRKHGNSQDPFFESAMTALLRNCLFVVMTAMEGKIDLGTVLDIVQTLPQSLNDVEEPERLRSMQLLAEAERRATPERQQEVAMARRYFQWEWPTLADRTRSSISVTLTTLLDAFLRYPLRQLFLQDLTVSPDLVLDGKIVIIDVPVKEFPIVGRIAGVIWKSSVQRAIERRPELTSGQPIETILPVAVLADEAQYWATPITDSYFQMTARSARGITLYSTQNITNLYAELGSDSTARARVDSLLGNLSTRIACQNLDHTTNHWLSESLGQVIVKRQSHSVTATNFLEGFLAEREASGKKANVSISEQLDYDLPPRVFTGLKRGGTPNKGIVEAIVVCAGDRFRANGKRWLRVSFNQFKEPKGWRRFISRNVLITVPRLKG